MNHKRQKTNIVKYNVFTKSDSYLRNWSQSSFSSWNSNCGGMPSWNTGFPVGSKPPPSIPPPHSRM